MRSGQSTGNGDAETLRELELKLNVTPDELRRLTAATAFAPFAVGAPTHRTLRSIYFDTREQRLRRAGMSLRVRSDGNAWLQAVKCGTEVTRGVSRPAETETPVRGPTPELHAIGDDALRRRITRMAQNSALNPVFEIVVRRTARRLRTAKGELELALDEGVVRAGSVEQPICEAELELKSGDAACLLEAATRLFAGSSLRLSESSKAERGYNLAFRQTVRRRAARAPLTPVGPDFTCLRALEVFIRSAEKQVEAGRLTVLNSDNPEGAHQLRIGLRRLRSALVAFGPFLETAGAREFDRHARALAKIVGELRDADILLADIVAPVKQHVKDHPGVPPLEQALRLHRLTKRDAARAALQGSAWSTLQLYFALWPLTMDNRSALDQPVAQISSKVLRKSWKKAARLGNRLNKLTATQRHDMRKALKQFRYTVEFFEPLYKASDVRRMIARLRKLQNLFGYLNDVAVARKIEAIAESQHPDDPNCQKAAAYVLGWHSSGAVTQWALAQSKWDRLRRKRNVFW